MSPDSETAPREENRRNLRKGRRRRGSFQSKTNSISPNQGRRGGWGPTQGQEIPMKTASKDPFLKED